jgi:UDP-glucose 4-epimerase
MKILVTGGSGFIGTVLIKKLLLDGYKVNCLDLNNSLNIKNKNFKFFKSSVMNEKMLNNASKRVQLIIHLAASMGVQNTDKNFIDCLDINILGTKKKQCKKNYIYIIIRNLW